MMVLTINSRWWAYALVAFGAQDINNNSDCTFFKTVYRRVTNFNLDAIDDTFRHAVNRFGKSNNESH